MQVLILFRYGEVNRLDIEKIVHYSSYKKRANRARQGHMEEYLGRSGSKGRKEKMWPKIQSKAMRMKVTFLGAALTISRVWLVLGTAVFQAQQCSNTSKH